MHCRYQCKDLDMILMQCYSLLILSRNTLLISKEAMTTVADIIAKGKPWGSVVRNGQSIAANAARKILRILVETLDSQSTSIFSSWLGMLHAFATLTIHIITHPGSRISTMDFHVSVPRKVFPKRLPRLIHPTIS